MTQPPFVSVIMPVRNEGRFMEKSLRAVLNQDYPRNQMEVIVADGMSTDETRTIIKNYQETYSNLQLIDNHKQIVAPGLNNAIRQSKGEIVVRVDGHTIIAPNYVHECVDAFQRITGADNVGGRMDSVAESNFGSAVALATSSRFGIGNAKFHYSQKEEMVDTVYLGAWRKSLFKQIGYFDEEMVRNQDDEFNYRLLENGGEIWLCPKINSKYYPRHNPIKLFRQYFEYGFWKVRVMQKHPRQMRVRQFVPVLFVATLIILGLTAVLSPIFMQFFFALIGVYLMANLVASVWGAIQRNWIYMFSLPFIYGIVHISYGLGFLAGLISFRKQ